MSHIAHPDVHTHGLHDGCAECGAAAANPLAFVDDEMLSALVVRLLGEGPSRSRAETIALNNVRDVLNRFARLAKLEPRALEWLARWGVTAPPAVVPAQDAVAAPETPPESVGTA